MTDQECFIETQYLRGGKGPAARMLVVSLVKLEALIATALAESDATTDDVMAVILEEAEDMDAVEDNEEAE